MIEALGSAAVTAGTLFGYNRKNYLYDRKMRQEQEFTTLEMRMKQAELWREDVRDITEMTGKKMDTYLVVNALQLGFCVTMYVEGKLEQGTPQWLLWLYMLSLSGAFMFLLLSVWLSLHASVVTTSSSVRILTQLVRPPVPSWDQLESMRTYAASYEAVPAAQMLRVPVLQTVAEGKKAGTGGYSSNHETDPGSGATDPWGLERRGDDIYELARRPLPQNRHVRLLGEASKHWKSYDAFARASMSLGSILMVKALGYFVLGYALINDGAPWAAWTVMGLMLCIASTIVRLDMSMTRSEYFRTQSTMILGPVLACLAAADWATWSLPMQRTALLFVPGAYLFYALFLLTFLRLCRVVEQPCGSMIPTSFRSVLFTDIFGWLTKGGKPKPPQVAEDFATQESGGYNSMSLVSCAPCTDDYEKSAQTDDDLPRDQKMQRAAGVLRSFTNRNVKAHLSIEEQLEVSRLSERLEGLRDESGCSSCCKPKPPPQEWVQLHSYSDCGQKVPYYVNTGSGQVSHQKPRMSGGGCCSSERPVGLPPSLSFATQQVEELENASRGRHGVNIEPRGRPVTFSPPGSTTETTASDGMDCEAQREVPHGSQVSMSSAKAARRRRMSYRALHGQNFPRHFDAAAPVALRPEDVELAAHGKNRDRFKRFSSVADDDDDTVEEEEWEDEGEDDRFPGVGPVGLIPEASKSTFDPSSFAPDLHEHFGGRGPSLNDDEGGEAEAATGRDIVEPGRLPWQVFRSAVRLLAGLSIIGFIWAVTQALELGDIPDKVLPESVSVSGEKAQQSEENFRGLEPPEDRLPSGQRILAKWPSERFQPRGLSADPTGRYFAISDEFDVYFASLKEEALPGSNGTTFRLDTFAPAPYCPALEGQANRDVAVLCKGAAKTRQEPRCDVMVLHAHGHRVAACQLSPTSADVQRRLLEGVDEEAGSVWTLSSKWLRDLGDGSKREEIISLSVDTDCQVPGTIDKRDSCVVVGTNHGRMVELRRHLSHNGELVPAGALWNVLGKAALAEQVEGVATSLLTAIPGGFVVALREGQRNVHAIDVERKHVVGQWRLPHLSGRTWTAIAGGATDLFIVSQGGVCGDAPEEWKDSKGYTCEDYITKKWCTSAGEYDSGWHMFWGSFSRYKNLEHTATTACCACGGGDREDTGATSQLWRFPLPEELRVLVAQRLNRNAHSTVKTQETWS